MPDHAQFFLTMVAVPVPVVRLDVRRLALRDRWSRPPIPPRPFGRLGDRPGSMTTRTARAKGPTGALGGAGTPSARPKGATWVRGIREALPPSPHQEAPSTRGQVTSTPLGGRLSSRNRARNCAVWWSRPCARVGPHHDRGGCPQGSERSWRGHRRAGDGDNVIDDLDAAEAPVTGRRWRRCCTAYTSPRHDRRLGEHRGPAESFGREHRRGELLPVSPSQDHAGPGGVANSWIVYHTTYADVI